MPKGVFSSRACPTCLKEVKSNAFSRHIKACPKPEVERKRRVAWNKGLTKEDPRVAKMAAKISKSLKGKKGHPLSEQQKRLLSALQSERLKKGYADGSRDQHGGYCKWFEVDGVKVQGTWEFRTAKILSRWKYLGKIKDWFRCPYRIKYTLDGKQHTYSPDFLVQRTDGTEYILEVKGRQSLVDDVKWKATSASFELVVWRLKDIEHNERETNKASVVGSNPTPCTISKRIASGLLSSWKQQM